MSAAIKDDEHAVSTVTLGPLRPVRRDTIEHTYNSPRYHGGLSAPSDAGPTALPENAWHDGVCISTLRAKH